MSEDDRGESRRQIARREQKRAGDRSARLAHTLMKVQVSALGKLDLDESVRRVIDQARAVTALVARRRAERSVAGALRGLDLVALDVKLAKVLATGTAEPEQFHLVEQWRNQMVEGGLAAAATFPGGVAEPLPTLILKAQSERATGKPPGAGRALFRHIAAALKDQQVAAAVAASDDPDVDDDPDDDDD